MTITHGVAAATEQTRARYPDAEGHVERDGVRISYEVYGEGETTVLLMPTWSIIHSRFWKLQIPYLARRFRLVAFDGRGNGSPTGRRSRRRTPRPQFAADALAVLDATATEHAVVASLSRGAERSLHLAAGHPERVDGLAFIAPALPLGSPATAARARQSASTSRATATRAGRSGTATTGCERLRGLPRVLLLPGVQRAALHEAARGRGRLGARDRRGDARRRPSSRSASPRTPIRCASYTDKIRCPVLVIHGRSTMPIRPHDVGAALAEMTGGALATLEGSGHIPLARDPVKVNLLLRDFVERTRPPTQASAASSSTWFRGRVRRKRALYVCSPIGLGHARRDVAIAKELRRLVPDLEIDWLAQHPVTRVLAEEGERIHPASAELANESHHIESESAEHDLHAFQAIRRMDEILCANYMVFDDLVTDEQYDLWIADEGWEVDYYLHENPDRKRAAYVWLTDFVGWLPMPDGREREAFLTADYNAEMIEHIARFPRVRDRALFVGNPDDVVPEQLRAGPAR